MNNDFNGNDLTVDKGSVQRNDDGPLGILNQRLNRDAIIQQQKHGLVEVGQDLAKQQKLVENLTREFEKMKSAQEDAFSDTQIKQAVKALEDYNKITDKLKYAITDITHSYEMGNISQEELNKKTTEYKKLLLEAQAAHEDAVDIIDIEHNKINDITDALKDQRNLRKVIHNEQLKAIDKEGKEAEKTFKNSSKDLFQAWQKSVKGAREFITSVKNTLNIEDLARKSEMSSAQRLQTQIQQMYGFKRTGFLGLNSDFQQWKTSGKSGVDTAIYSSDDFKKAIEVIPDLNLSAQKAADLMPTLVRGQKLLGMTAEEQTKLSVLSTRTGRDMLTYTTNRIAQYMKNDEKLNLKQLNQMIELNANLATTAAEYGIDGDFMSSLTDATKAMTDVFGQNSGKDNVYRNAAESIFSNYETAARVYGMEEGQIREYLSNGGNLYDLNKNSSGAANYVYEQLIRDYEGTLNNWQKYSEIIGDQNIANLVKSQAEAQKKHGVDLSSQTKANAATAKSADALNEMEKDYKDNMSLTQKFFSKASNWIDDQFDWVTQENFYRDVIAALSIIEMTLIGLQKFGDLKSLFGKGGGSGSGLGLGNLLSGTGKGGKLFGAGSFLGGASGVSKFSYGTGALGTLAKGAGIAGLAWTGIDAFKGATSYAEQMHGKDATVGQRIGGGLVGAFSGTKVYTNKDGSVNTGKNVGMGALSGAAKGALIGSFFGPVGTLVGGLIGAAGGAIAGGVKSKDYQKQQLEEQKKIAKNTASSAASMEALRSGMSLTGNSYDSRVPRKATMSDSELKLKTPPGNEDKGGSPKDKQPTNKDPGGSVKDKTSPKINDKAKNAETKPATIPTPSTNGMLTYQDKNKDKPKLGAAMGSSPSAAGSPYPWRVSAGYNHYPDGSYHNGMDFAIAEGTKIGAAKPGTVEKVQEDGRNTYYNDYGMSLSQRIAAGSGVWVRGDDGNRYYYWHMSKVAVKQGDKVPEGALLGYAGNTGYSTGSHLHFGVQLSGGSYTEPANFVTSGLFNASGEAYTPSKSTSGLKNEATNKSSDINDILTSSYKVKLNSHYVGMGSGPGGTGFKDNTLSDVVSGLSEIKQTLINLSDRQTQDERIMNMISRQPRQDPRMS